MKKYIPVLLFASILSAVLGFNANSVSAEGGSNTTFGSTIVNYGSSSSSSNPVSNSSGKYTYGCTSTNGYSPLTGEKCKLLTTNSSLPYGCTSTNGYSPLTGVKCDSQVSSGSLPAGCTSTIGYSPLTGVKCDSGGTPVTPSYPPGCTSFSGFSYTTGQACNGKSPNDPVSNNQAVNFYIKDSYGNIQDSISFYLYDSRGGSIYPTTGGYYAPYYDIGPGTYSGTMIVDGGDKVGMKITADTRGYYLSDFYMSGDSRSTNLTVKISTDGAKVTINSMEGSSSDKTIFSLKDGYNKSVYPTLDSGVPMYKIPVGTYTVTIGDGYSTGGSSETAILKATSTSYNLSDDSTYTTNDPVISGVKGPQSLDVGQKGTWSVSAYDAKAGSGNLSYSVIWGDETEKDYSFNRQQQGATFTHVYYRAGNYTPVFYVYNEKGQSSNTSLSVNIGKVATTINITNPSTLHNAKVGTSFKEYLGISGVDFPYGYNTNSIDWTVGTPLPAGLYLTASDNGEMITGTPTRAGTYDFYITASTASLSQSHPEVGAVSTKKNLTLTVEPSGTQSSFKVLSPNGGETWQSGADVSVSFNPSGAYGKSLTVVLINGDTTAEYQMGNSFTGQSTDRQVFYFSLPTAIPTGSHYKVRVSNCDTGDCSIQDVSDNYFTITSSVTPTIKVTSPNGGEVWNANSYQTINWNVGDSSIAYVNLTLRKSGSSGATHDLYLQAPNTGSVTFFLSSYPAGTYFLRIEKENGTLLDESDSTFSINNSTTTCSSSGYDTNTGYKCGCSSTSGFSLTTGASCGTDPVISPISTSCSGTAFSDSKQVSWGSSVSGGTGNYSYSWSAYNDVTAYTGGSTSSGSFSASYGSAGTKQAVVRVTDSAGNSATDDCSANITVVTPPSSLSITTSSSLPDATVGQYYKVEIGTTGGVNNSGYSSTLAPGSSSLPPGISWSTCSTSICAGIAGTPTTPGTYNFTVQITQGSNVARKEFSLRVGA